jgi:hypothetical protein
MSGKDKRTSAHVNEGIQATTVNAEVLAVGRSAKASKIGSGGDDQGKLAQAVQQLDSALRALQLKSYAETGIEQDLKDLHAAVQAKEPQPDRVVQSLQGIGGKLKMVGVVLTDALALSEPITYCESPCTSLASSPG